MDQDKDGFLSPKEFYKFIEKQIHREKSRKLHRNLAAGLSVVMVIMLACICGRESPPLPQSARCACPFANLRRGVPAARSVCCGYLRLQGYL